MVPLLRRRLRRTSPLTPIRSLRTPALFLAARRRRHLCFSWRRLERRRAAAAAGDVTTTVAVPVLVACRRRLGPLLVVPAGQVLEPLLLFLTFLCRRLSEHVVIFFEDVVESAFPLLFLPVHAGCCISIRPYRALLTLVPTFASLDLLAAFAAHLAVVVVVVAFSAAVAPDRSRRPPQPSPPASACTILFTNYWCARV